MSIVYETMLGTLGSRFHMNFRPREKCIYTSPMGRFYDGPPQRLSIGIQIGEEVRILPFSDQYPVFASVEQEITPTSVTFHCREPELGIAAEITITAPFYPQDEKISLAPFFYIHATATNIGVPKLQGDALQTEAQGSVKGELFIEAHGEWTVSPDGGSCKQQVQMTLNEEIARRKGLARTRGKDFSCGEFQGEIALATLNPEKSTLLKSRISAPFHLSERQTDSLDAVFAGYTDQAVMSIEDVLHTFKYTAMFGNIEEVIEYARDQHDIIREKCGFFDRLFANASLDKSAAQLIAFSLQSYLSNTWWVESSSGTDWFTVWEGNCAYHSTIDVEYNSAMFYLMLWPELLEKTIRQWTRYEREAGAFMSHDMGKFLVGRGMEYGHDMEIEENCNFILLLHAHRNFTGHSHLAKTVYPQVKRLIQYVADSDTTGNGFPNTGTANTIDDAGAAVQYAKEQTYLAVKAYSAYLVVQEMAGAAGDDDTVNLCVEQMAKIRDTLEREAWIDDHYAVCLNASAEGIRDVWSGQTLTGDIPGWVACSIYSSNGLLYPLMTGMEIGLEVDRLRTDLRTATARSMTRYGCKHSSKDTTDNLWISQNLWKDMTASYLGLDMLSHSDQYWDYELYENAQGIGGCFVDAPPKAHLNYYPRGITSLGLLYAMAGVQLDRTQDILHYNPVRVPCAIPLLSLARWEDGEVPWVEFRLEDGMVEVERSLQTLGRD
jgi:hypothetical protein